VAAGVTLRQSVLGGQLPCRGGDVVAVGQQRHGGVGALRALVGAGSSTTRHDIRILPLVSNRASRQFHTPVGQSSLELEVAYCVGGVTGEPCGVPAPVGVVTPSSSTPARSQPRSSFSI